MTAGPVLTVVPSALRATCTGRTFSAPMKLATNARRRGIVDLLGRADLGDPSCIQDDEAIGHGHGFLAIMRDVDGGDAEPLLDRADLVAHRHADLGVEIGQWLVEQQDAWIDRQRPAECDALALPAGQRRDLALLVAAQPQHREQRSHLG